MKYNIGEVGKWWNERDGHHRREQGNNAEAIRVNGGIISTCYIISTDSSIMSCLNRFHNTPRALILGKLSSGCHLDLVCVRRWTWKERSECSRDVLLSLFRSMWLMGRLTVFFAPTPPQLKVVDSWGRPCTTSSLSSVFLHTLIPFTDQIKAQTTNTQKLVTSVLEHTVHPSPSWAPLVTTQSQSPCRQHLQQWTSAH